MLYKRLLSAAWFWERVNGAIPLPVSALDVDLNTSRSDINFLSPEIIFRYQIQDDSLVSRVCGTMAVPGRIQRDWDESGLWFACVNDGGKTGDIYKSTDDGNTWTTLSPSKKTPLSCLMPDSTSTPIDYLYAAGADTVYISTNNGNSWITPATITRGDIRAMDIRPDGNDTLIIADHGGGAYRSTNHGSTWSQINSGLTNTYAYCIKYCPEKSDIALIGTAVGVFKSTNLNSATPTWSKAWGGAPVVAIDFHATYNAMVFMSARDDDVGKMYISPDTARSWIQIGGGLGNNIVHDIASDPDNPDTIYVATDDGIYRMVTSIHCGTITSNETWGPGTVIVNGDVTVSSGDTLTIEDSTTVLITYNYDEEQGGADSTKCEIIIEGTLIANGTSSDSILFISSREPIDSSQAGDWYGIRFKANSEGTMEYCAIRNAIYGIEMKDTSDVDLEHCLIKDNQSKGIDNYKGELSASNCVLEDNLDYGVYSEEAESVIDSCDFDSNEKYAIYCKKNPITGLDSTKIAYCTIDNGGTVPASSQYGVFLDYLDKARIYKCTIQEYSQGAIKLKSSDALIFNNTLSNHGIYGIYSETGSSPKIRQCEIDSDSIGVRAYNSTIPNIGVDPGDPGNCSFDSSMSYFIYFDGFEIGVAETLWAQDNWYGSDDPDSSKFYSSNQSRIIMWTPYLDSLPPPPKLNVGPWTPYVFSLDQNYPNPFNPWSTISFTLDKPGHTIVTVYNILGQKVIALVDGYLDTGKHSVTWNGRDASAVNVRSGVYFYTIECSDQFDSKKMVLLR